MLFKIENLSHEGRGITHYDDEHHAIEKHGKKYLYVMLCLMKR